MNEVRSVPLPTVVPPTWNVPKLPAGQRVRISQMIVGREGRWTTRAEGTVLSCQPETTGSWYAHGKNDKLWLLRVRLQKADGEVTTLVIDHNSKVEAIG